MPWVSGAAAFFASLADVDRFLVGPVLAADLNGDLHSILAHPHVA
ncbi:MAG TPA: hypothetical protein VF493_17360 [Terriglobales bacterium]